VTSGGWTGTGTGIAGSPGNETLLEVDVVLSTCIGDSSPIYAITNIVALMVRFDADTSG
jgi:hypothetical protein